MHSVFFQGFYSSLNYFMNKEFHVVFPRVQVCLSCNAHSTLSLSALHCEDLMKIFFINVINNVFLWLCFVTATEVFPH